MAWVSVLLALLQLAGSLTDYLQRRRIIEDAQAKLIKQNLEFTVETVNKAKNARAAAHDKFTASGGVLDDNDPNLRD